MFRQFSIRARLLFAFFGISMFAVLAAAAALYSFLEVGKIINQISEFEAPASMAFLSRSSAIAALPVMRVSSSVASSSTT